ILALPASDDIEVTDVEPRRRLAVRQLMLLHVQQNLPFERLVIANPLGTEAGHTMDPIGRHPAAQRMWTPTMPLRYRRNPGIALAILLSRRQFDRFTVLLHEITPKLISNFWGSLQKVSDSLRVSDTELHRPPCVHVMAATSSLSQGV